MENTSKSAGGRVANKLLALMLCGLGGYIAAPYVFPTAEEVEEVVVVEDKGPVRTVWRKDKEEVKEEKLANIVVDDVKEKVVVPEPEPDEEYDLGPKNPFEDGRLVLVGTQATSSKELAKDADFLRQAGETGMWTEYQQMLLLSMGAEYEKVRIGSGKDAFKGFWGEPRYYRALLRWKVLGKFSGSVLATTKDEFGSKSLMGWLMENDEAMEEVLLTVEESDDSESVFRFLSRIWLLEDVEQSIAEKYFNLSLACAVVFDRKIAYTNPVTGFEHVDGLQRFRWYVEKNEGGLLEGKVDRASARDLTFVVCSPISEDEMEWALRKYRSKSRKSWGETYSDVEYLMERAVEGLNPYDAYVLPEILKEGGICGDQSYFCVNTARAAGIPAFTLVGETDLGGHAWAAVKVKPDEWSTTVGRIGGVSKGQGNDFQSGGKVIEQEVWLWNEREHQVRDNLVRVWQLMWLADQFDSVNEKELHDQAVYAAHAVGMKFPKIWDVVYEVMSKDPEFVKEPSAEKVVAAWKGFVSDLKREFKDNPRMGGLANVVQDKHVFPFADLGDVRRDLARDRRRGTRDAKEQADLVTTSLKRECDLLLKRDEVNAKKEIGQLYDRALRDYGGSVSGFRTMAEDYFNFMKDDEEVAQKSVRDIELAFNRVVNTDSGDWFRKKVEVGLHRKICQMYREVGEVKRAENMERRLERQMKNAKRKAL